MQTLLCNNNWGTTPREVLSQTRFHSNPIRDCQIARCDLIAAWHIVRAAAKIAKTHVSKIYYANSYEIWRTKPSRTTTRVDEGKLLVITS